MKKVISMLLVLALCLSGLALAEDAQPAVYRLGDKMDDFTLAPYPWEIHTLKVPEGYEGDTETVTTAPVEGGELTFTLTKQ